MIPMIDAELLERGWVKIWARRLMEDLRPGDGTSHHYVRAVEVLDSINRFIARQCPPADTR